MDQELRGLEQTALNGDQRAEQQLINNLKRLHLVVYSKKEAMFFATNDKETNQAIQDGFRITLKLEINDLVLVEETHEFPATANRCYLGVIINNIREQEGREYFGVAQIIDLLGGELRNCKENLQARLDATDRIYVLRRQGKGI